MKRTLITILILIVATAALAAPPGRGPAPGNPGRGPQAGPSGALLSPADLAAFLELTESQIGQVQTLRESQRATIEPLIDQQRANQQQLEEALAAGNTARAGELAVANYNLRQQIKAAHDAFATAFEALLTDGQKAKWAVYQEIAELRRHARPE